MLFTLIVSVMAGVAAPFVQDHVTAFLLQVFGEDRMPDAGGRRVATFALALLGGAILLALVGADSAPVLVILGGTVGYFHKEIRGAVMDRMG